jgi:hypothetical protein
MSIIALCRVIYEHADLEHERCVSEFLRHRPHYLPPITKRGCANINLARALVAQYAITAGADAMLCVDADVSWENDPDIDRMVEEALSRNAVVGGIYVRRHGQKNGVVGVPVAKTLNCFGGGKLEPATRVGMGCTVIPTKVYLGTAEWHRTRKRVVDEDGFRVFPLFSSLVEDSDEYPSGDYAFSDRVRQAGFSVFIDTRPRIVHHMRVGVTLDDLARGRVVYENLELTLKK